MSYKFTNKQKHEELLCTEFLRNVVQKCLCQNKDENLDENLEDNHAEDFFEL